MLKKVLAMLPTGLLLTVGCATKTDPGSSGPDSAAGRFEKVTIFVESMIQRQGIT